MSQTEYRGQRDQFTDASQFNAMSFLVNQILAGRNTSTLVQIKAVTNAGELSPVGYVDVLPLVNQLDGSGVAYPHGVVHNLPYFRLQGGANAVIIDPQVGDIGVVIFADRDISAVKATGAAANPGSMRRADMADGMYMGGLLNGVPSQYVQFNTDGITIHSPVKITLSAPDIVLAASTVEINASSSATITTPIFTVNGASQFNGTVTASGTITAPLVVGTSNVTFGGKSGTAHTHGGVSNGSGTSGPPS